LHLEKMADLTFQLCLPTGTKLNTVKQTERENRWAWK